MYPSTDYRSLMKFSAEHANEKMFGQFINNKKKRMRGGWKRR